jgi:DNA-binding PadR family transcriptional regulator
MKISSADDLTPLSPQVYQIMVMLWNRPQGGHDLITQAWQKKQLELSLELSSGMVYQALRRLQLYRLIEVGEPYENGRKRYQLTSLGQQILQHETKRLRQLIQLTEGRQP